MIARYATVACTVTVSLMILVPISRRLSTTYKDEVHSPDVTGSCDDGYYCDEGQSHPRQHMAQPGFYAA